MKASEQEIKKYCYMLFMMSDLDWNGYLSLMQLESKMIKKGEIIWVFVIGNLNGTELI